MAKEGSQPPHPGSSAPTEGPFGNGVKEQAAWGSLAREPWCPEPDAATSGHGGWGPHSSGPASMSFGGSGPRMLPPTHRRGRVSHPESKQAGCC